MPVMKTFAGQSARTMSRPAVLRFYTARDVIIIVLLTAGVIAIGAHAPSNNYAYAQRWQAGANIGVAEGGNWLLPRNQAGGVARKGPLYAWLGAPALMLTGIYDDFIFRVPTVAAALATALCVYVLGRWWYGRRVALLAACLWATAHHMGKLTYLGTTDMLLTLWITCSIMCIDRLVFHPVARHKRKWWACGLWVTMILGALTKGWGVVNLPLVAAMTALAAALGPGFDPRPAGRRPAGDVPGGRPAGDVPGGRLGGAILRIIRLVGRRWWNAIKAVGLWWGLGVFVAVMGLMVWGMFVVGGEDFRRLVNFELVQRVTGEGADPPAAASVPPILYLLYYLLPVSIFAMGSLLLVRLSRWFTQKGPIYLCLCWVIAVVVLFSLPHGFGPHYLLPCYAPMALMAAWAIHTVTIRRKRGGKLLHVLRHAFAGVPVVIGVGLVVVALAYLLHGYLPQSLAKLLPLPAEVRPESWWLLGAVIPFGVAVAAWGIRSSLRWQLRRVAFTACVGMLGVMFVYGHFASRHAQTGDGEKMRRFAQRAREIVGDDRVVTFWTSNLCVRMYLGRLGPLLVRPGAEKARAVEVPMEKLASNGIHWMITCDRGLVEMGQFREVADGTYKVKVSGGVRTFRTLPELLSDGPIEHSSETIEAGQWGRLYLIRLKLGARPYAKPESLGYAPRPAR